MSNEALFGRRVQFRTGEQSGGGGDPRGVYAGFKRPSGEGLANMRQRLEEIGGRFDLKTRAGAGTVCQFWLRMEPVGRGEGEETSNG